MCQYHWHGTTVQANAIHGAYHTEWFGFSYLHQNDAENIVLHFQQVCISQVHKANEVDEIVGGNWKMMSTTTVATMPPIFYNMHMLANYSALCRCDLFEIFQIEICSN